jgi:hypothetical protein
LRAFESGPPLYPELLECQAPPDRQIALLRVTVAEGTSVPNSR